MKCFPLEFVSQVRGGDKAESMKMREVHSQVVMVAWPQSLVYADAGRDMSCESTVFDDGYRPISGQKWGWHRIMVIIKITTMMVIIILPISF